MHRFHFLYHFLDLASYVSLNFVDLICRRRDFPVKTEIFYDFQYFLMYTRLFDVIFSYNKTKNPRNLYVQSRQKLLTWNIYYTNFNIFIVDIEYVNVGWKYFAF